MKNNLRYYAIVSCCMLGLNACQEETLVQNDSQGSVTIIGRLKNDMLTRTCVDSSSPEGVAGILWSPKDAIGVYGDNGTKNALFEATNTVNTAEAQFIGSMTSGDTPAYAYYPYSADNAAAEVEHPRIACDDTSLAVTLLGCSDKHYCAEAYE